MTIIQTPSGEIYGTSIESVTEAMDRLQSAGWLVQRIDNVVRLVRRQRSVRPVERRQLVCAWCDKLMRPGATPASHGICEPCYKAQFEDERSAWGRERPCGCVEGERWCEEAQRLSELRKRPGLEGFRARIEYQRHFDL